MSHDTHLLNNTIHAQKSVRRWYIVAIFCIVSLPLILASISGYTFFLIYQLKKQAHKIQQQIAAYHPMHTQQEILIKKKKKFQEYCAQLQSIEEATNAYMACLTYLSGSHDLYHIVSYQIDKKFSCKAIVTMQDIYSFIESLQHHCTWLDKLQITNLDPCYNGQYQNMQVAVQANINHKK